MHGGPLRRRLYRCLPRSGGLSGKGLPDSERRVQSLQIQARSVQGVSASLPVLAKWRRGGRALRRDYGTSSLLQVLHTQLCRRKVTKAMIQRQ